MSKELIRLKDEAIRLEESVSKLYLLFRDVFSEDADFWQQLAIEENNHAELIRSCVDLFMQVGLFPAEILPASRKNLQIASAKLETLQKQYAKEPPSREEALNVALETEQSAGEIHFQRLMEQRGDSRVVDLFQKLNQDDKDHANRILAYMKEKGIPERIQT